MFEGQSTLINTIIKLRRANQFKKYIEFIQFPYYRNIELNARINFDFPFTVFIGQNGCGKSSALHALYGTVKGKTPSQFWFDTEVDPIQYFDDEKRRHSFWYSHKDDNGNIVEVIKARIKREGDPNYWETSRPLDWAGMKKGDGGNRNPPLNKEVIYLDFREELSAFDKFFYFGSEHKNSSKFKQTTIRKKSKFLSDVFHEKIIFAKSGTKKLNGRLQKLNPEELETISFILGRNYTSGRVVKHSIFSNEGYSVLFTTSFASYSEAFAGSGEMAVVRLVKEVLAAKEYSLILLDEPEVSLHPGAQARLKLFLLDQIKRKKHQIILTSHSPVLIQGIPKEGIKVFQQNITNGRFLITENLLPEEAFYFIEYPLENKKNIIVEDKLAKEILLAVLKHIGSATENLFNISFYAGGASILKQNFITVYCRHPNSNQYIIFDGDQKNVANHFNWKELPLKDLNINTLQKFVQLQTGENIKFLVDGGIEGGNENQQMNLIKQYLEYYQSNVFYFPKATPEEIIWNDEKASKLIKVLIDEISEQEKIISNIRKETCIKKKFAILAKIALGDDKNESIYSVQKFFIQTWVDKEDQEYHEVKNIILKIMS